MSGPVVVGVDGSPSSLAAVEVAAREARLRGSGLRLVHAFGWPSGHVPPGVPPWNPADVGLRVLVDGTLADAERRAQAVAPQVDVTRDVVVGEPLTVLEIESRTAELAVVGTRGLGKFAALLLGSTAVHLVTHGRCPVLVVRGRPDPEGPVLLAVDGSRGAVGAVEFAFAEASLRGAELLALHVWNICTERAYDHPADPPFASYDEERLRAVEERLLAESLCGLRDKYQDVAVRHRLVRGRIRPSLIEAGGGAQLVVVGARGRGGFAGLLLGSVSQAVLQHAHCPVAVVRTGKE
ncbi:universal stress protein [Streptomyces sp. TRM66268-LWL]|uniref:Universal stress protein n=1 Tax=Streptomyces polyasparticus TaxID=2767826 RepID=A0ABR7SHE5_9ACTN|nr:universal stress protein [Streptomyces polyasparticus]MBC9713906.1 universal stress protein [Streptomyces polyasparticus]